MKQTDIGSTLAQSVLGEFAETKKESKGILPTALGGAVAGAVAVGSLPDIAEFKKAQDISKLSNKFYDDKNRLFELTHNADTYTYAGTPEYFRDIANLQESVEKTGTALEATKGRGLLDLNNNGTLLDEGAMIGLAVLGGAALGKGLHKAYKKHKAKKAEKAGDHSEGDMAVNLSDRDIKRFENARTNLILNETYFPSRKGKKFKFDVERQVLLNQLAEKGDPEILKRLEEIDAMNRKPNGFWKGLYYGSTGSAYHTPKAAVQATTDLINANFDVSMGKKLAHQVIGAYPKQVTGDARNAYWDMVDAVSKLSPEEREAAYGQMDKFHKNRAATDWGSALLAGSWGSGANHLYQSVTLSDRYRKMTDKMINSESIKSPDSIAKAIN